MIKSNRVSSPDSSSSTTIPTPFFEWSHDPPSWDEQVKAVKLLTDVNATLKDGDGRTYTGVVLPKALVSFFKLGATFDVSMLVVKNANVQPGEYVWIEKRVVCTDCERQRGITLESPPGAGGSGLRMLVQSSGTQIAWQAESLDGQLVYGNLGFGWLGMLENQMWSGNALRAKRAFHAVRVV